MPSISQTQFITLAHQVHNNLYDYSNVVYKNTTQKVEIICRIHGSFYKTKNKHIDCVQGCPKCSDIESGRKRFKQAELRFKDTANKVHNFRYDYSLINYNGSDNVVSIICEEHGIFKQVVSTHLSGCGCQSCHGGNKYWNYLYRYTTNSHLGSQPGIFYKLKFKHKTLGFEFLKVGITSKSIKQRYRRYKDYSYEILEECLVTNLESALLENEFLKNTNLKKFYFPKGCVFVGHTECFTLANDNRCGTSKL